jgi:hypothetical protein
MKNKLSLLLILFGFLFFSTNSINAQTITEKPIYKGINGLTIRELKSGGIYFSYQNPEYTTIVDIVSFNTSSKLNAIQLFEKAITILGMEKTDKEQHIIDNFEGVELARYGFSQKQISLSNGKNRGIYLTLKDCNKIKDALSEYQYIHQSDN